MRTVVIVIALAALVVGAVFFMKSGPRAPEHASIPPDTVDFPPGGEAPDPLTDQLGRWRVASVPASQLSAADTVQLEKLEALPYLQGYRPAPTEQNVTVHDPVSVQAGYNLYNSGHAPEAFMTDMDGDVVHTWRYAHTRAFPGAEPRLATSYFRRVRMLDDGGLLVIFDSVGIVRIDANSNTVWARPGRFHHDLDVAEDGAIYTIKHAPAVIRRRGAALASLPDDIVVLDANGEWIAQTSILQAFRRSDYAHILRYVNRLQSAVRDIFHTNSIRVLDGSLADVSPHFKKGNVIISLLRLDTIAIVDPAAGRVVWASTANDHDLWRRQHDPTLLPGGTMLLFDNRGHDGRSKVIELDPLTNQVVWQYADAPQQPFYSMTCGAAQRLPNGNTLISESDNGRAFEVDAQGEIVWEFWNPHRAGEHGELIATLFEMRRLTPDQVDWLDTNKKAK